MPEDLPNQNLNTRDPRQPADFEPISLARHLLRSTRSGALGSLNQAGYPFTSLVSIATESAGAPILLLSRLSEHTRNLLADQRCSLLLSQPGKGDPLAHPRMTLIGRALWVEEPEKIARIRRRFLARHPKAQLYVDFPDFAFCRIEATHFHLNGGFARAYDGAAIDILSPLPNEEAFDALELSALAHMNADHADIVAHYASHLCKQSEGAWRATGLDPHGLDLALGDKVARVAFETPVYEGGSLRTVLAQLADKTRA